MHFQISVFVITLSLLGVGIWGLTELETKFDSTWFLPQDSYIAKWVSANAKYFPNDGERVTVYITDVNLTTDLSKIATFIEQLEENDNVVSSVNSWIPGFKDYLEKGSCYFTDPLRNTTELGSLFGNTQCENFRTFLPLRFNAKLILFILKF